MLVSVLIIAAFCGCGKASEKSTGFEIGQPSFRDIPGVSGDEIIAIESLQSKYSSFVYGMNPTTEAFIGKSGEIEGYAALFCDWLTQMFGIPFTPALYEWGDLLTGLRSGGIDFTGEIMATPERLKSYFMTGPIADRLLKFFRIEGSDPLQEIRDLRLPRYAFLEGSVAAADITESVGYDFVTVFIHDYNTAYRLLQSGEVDAFIDADIAEAAFDVYGNVIAEDIFPLIYQSGSLSTRKAELAPVISVVQKALDSDSSHYISGLYRLGWQSYMKYRLYLQLTEEERAYIESHSTVLFAAEHFNYPISFYNSYENQWQGICFDLLSEVETLTGLRFEPVNDQYTEWPDLLKLLEDGDASLVTELIRSKGREGRFLWLPVTVLSDYYALLSKSSYPDLDMKEIMYAKVGVTKDTVYSELFRNWFPNHPNTVEYVSFDDAFRDLEKGELDLVMTSERWLQAMTHYYELTGYKANVVFNQASESTFGFNINETVLCSIVGKAVRYIDIKRISDKWMRMTFDYRHKLAQIQRKWLIGVLIVFTLMLIVVSFLWVKTRHNGRRLRRLVRQRTGELSLQTASFKTMIESIPEIVFFKDLKSKYTLCNRAFLDYFQLNEEDILGKGDIDGLKMPADAAKKAIDMDRRIISEAQKIIYEETIPSFDNRMQLFETIKAPLMQGGKVIGIIGIARDITERKAMEEEAKEASRSKSAFLANMSHELRTPLNVVIGLTDIVLEENHLSEHVKENLLKISDAGSTLLSLVNDLLDFSKIESGKLVLIPVEYHMSSLLNDVITLVNTRIGEKPITFKLNISDELFGRLYGDDLRVKQIFNNLLSNAIKYTHAGAVELSVDCTRGDDGVRMEISVSDTGIGIQEKELGNLFQDYYQVDSRTNRKIEGTGLGLSITKKLVDLMDGKITVESTYGEGTTFRVNIKQGYVNGEQIGKNVADNLRNFHYAEDKRLVTQKLVRLNLDYAKVLVVDDMRTNLDVAAGLLRKYRMQVDCVTSGREALEKIRGESPVYDAVFMDHMMPGMDGIETTEAIRAIDTEYARKVPVIALTANAIQGTEEMFYRCGFQAFISKPIDIMQLDAVVRKWVRNETRKEYVVDKGTVDNSVKEVSMINIPGVDPEKGLALYGGEMDIYLTVLRSYADNTPAALDKLRNVTAETLSDYVITVHGLKGTSANIGAETTREAAYKLEKLSREGDLVSVLERSGRFIKETENLVASIYTWLQKYDENNVKPLHEAPDREVLARLRVCCMNFDMKGIDEAMTELESADYERDGELVTWLREKINISEIDEIAQRLGREVKQ